MKLIPHKRVKLIVFSFFGLLLLSLLIFMFVSYTKKPKQTKKSHSDIPVSVLAPHSILTPPENLYNTTANNTSYNIDNTLDGMKIKIDGKEYFVDSNGNIYEIKDDGSLNLITDEETIGKVNRAVLDVILNTDEGKDKLGKDIDNFTQNVGAKGFSEEDKQKLIDQYNKNNGTNITLSDYNQGIKDGKSISEIFTPHPQNDNVPSDDIIIGEETPKQEKSTPTLKPNFLRNKDISSSIAPNSPPLNSPLNSSNKKDDTDTLTPVIPSLSIPQNNDSVAAAINNLNQNSSQYNVQNGQDDKNNFMQKYNSVDTTSSFLTQNDIAIGTVIPCILVNGINSDLPGMIIAQTTQNIYDTLTGQNLLIPKGTRLSAEYSSKITFGQNRLLVAFTSLTRPDGYHMALSGFNGVDNMGASGFTGSVNNHIASIIASGTISSLIDVGLGIATQSANDATARAIISSLTSSSQTAADKYLDKVQNTQPTIKIPPGKNVSLIVNKNITLSNIRSIY